MAPIRGAKSRKFSVREDTAAMHDVVSDHEGPELGGLKQHETSPDDASVRKHKAARCNIKNQKDLKAKEPRLTETPSCGPKSHVATQKLQEANSEGSGACDGLGGSEPSGSGSVVGRHVAATDELKGATSTKVDVVRAAEPEVLVCAFNQNPADFLMSFESGYFRRL